MPYRIVDDVERDVSHNNKREQLYGEEYKT